MQSDCGGENNVVANCHTVIHHRLDPSLAGTLQHRWCVEKSNIKPEALWSQLWCQFTPGFETQLDYGLNNGLYNPDDPLKKYVSKLLDFTLLIFYDLKACFSMACNPMASGRAQHVDVPVQQQPTPS